MKLTKVILFLLTLNGFVNGSSLLALGALKCDSLQPALGRWELVGILKRGGFSGILDEYMNLKRVGNILISGNCFTLFVYVREAASEPGTNVHGAMRLVVIKDYEYLGMYSIDDPPLRIVATRVEFPGKKELGVSFEFAKDGPPSSIYLGGFFRERFK